MHGGVVIMDIRISQELGRKIIRQPGQFLALTQRSFLCKIQLDGKLFWKMIHPLHLKHYHSFFHSQTCCYTGNVPFLANEIPPNHHSNCNRVPWICVDAEVGVHSRFHRRVPRSCIFPKDGEDDPKAYQLLLDKMLNRTMALRVKVQPTFSSASVQRFSKKPEVIQAVLDQIDPDEGTSKHEVLEVIQTVGHTNDEPKPQVEKSDADESVHFHTVPKCYK